MIELKDLFPPYEESLAMRELGFDVLCLAWYDGRYKELNREYSKNSEDWLKGIHCSAPLYQQTLDFFRKKGYHIEIYSDNHQDILNADNWYWLFSKGVNTSCTDSFGSYEEARLDCIRALIKTELNNKS